MHSYTLEEIGKLAGVSRSTVSRVINDHPNVSDKVRKRVNQVIAETNFSPHIAARTLATQKSCIIGLVIPRSLQEFFGDPYFARMTQGIAKAANSYDYTFSVFLLENLEIENRLIPRITRPGFIDGLIIQSTSADDQVISRVINGSIPYVIAGRPLHYENITFIDVNNVEGGRIAVEYLIRLNRTRIAIITGPLDTSPGLDRKVGYEKALEQNGISVDDDLVIEGDFTEDGGYLAAQKLLSFEPDAIFSASDTMAIGALRAIKEKGLRVPEDIALVGFDDLSPALYADPPLTTIRQPVMRFGYAAVEMLMQCINGDPTPPSSRILDVELIIRDSCGGNHR